MKSLNQKPFNTPDFYFEKLEDSILKQTVGASIKKNIWNTPESYFERLEEDIFLKTINTDNKQKNKIRQLFTKKTIWFSAAASILFIGVLFFSLQNNEAKVIPSIATHTIDPVIEKQIQIEKPVVENNKSKKEDLNKTYVSRKPVETTHSLAVNNTKEDYSITTSSEVIYDLYFNEETDYFEEDYYF